MEITKVSRREIYRSSSLLSPILVGRLLVVIISLVFFEDLLRSLFPIGSGGWLLLKDLLLLLLYGVFAMGTIFTFSSSVAVPRITGPLLAYFLATCLIYFYSVSGHQRHFGAAIIGARADLFYVPLVFAFFYASRWSRFPNILFSLFTWVAVVNSLVAWVQISFPEILDSVPGFSGLREEGHNLHESRSFHDGFIDYVFGMFSGVGKLTRNLFNIFIWLWLIHVVFNVGRVRTVLIMSGLIGIILLISSKRLPILLWIVFMLLIPIVMHFAGYITRYSTQWKYRQSCPLRRIKYKMVTAIILLILGMTFMFLFSAKMRLYADFVIYALEHGIAERFFARANTSHNYFWNAELNRITSNLAVFGQGAGTSTQGVHYVLTEDDFVSAGYFGLEHGPLKVWLEFGLLGLMQMFLLWGGLFLMDLMVMIKVRHRARWLAASMLILIYHLCTLAMFFVGHQYWGDVQFQIHFWLITGLILWMWQMSNSTLTCIAMPSREKVL